MAINVDVDIQSIVVFIQVNHSWRLKLSDNLFYDSGKGPRNNYLIRQRHHLKVVNILFEKTVQE